MLPSERQTTTIERRIRRAVTALGYRGDLVFEHGHWWLMLPTVPVVLAACTLLAQGVFGPGRPCGGSTKWTGDSHRFGIYLVDKPMHRILIFRTDGSGASFYLVDETDAIETWTALGALPSTLLWNLCMTLTETYRQGGRAERRLLFDLFLAGRLKKRRRRSTTWVEIAKAVEPVQAIPIERQA